MPITVPSETNIDVICAKIHARRASMYEKERLVELTGLRGFPNLVAKVFPEQGLESHRQFERRLVEDHIAQLSWILAYFGGHPFDLFKWLLRRYQLENLKVLLRGFLAGRGPRDVSRHLVAVGEFPEFPAEQMLTAASAEAFAEAIPDETVKSIVQKAFETSGRQAEPFYIEAALDTAYYRKLLHAADEASLEDLAGSRPLLVRDANMHLVSVALRARFNYDAAFDAISRFLSIPHALAIEDLQRAFDAADVPAAVRALPGAFALPADAESVQDIERAFLASIYEVANNVFYAAGVSFAVPVAFFYLKRIELRNLIHLTEAYRYEMRPEEMRRGLVPAAE